MPPKPAAAVPAGDDRSQKKPQVERAPPAKRNDALRSLFGDDDDDDDDPLGRGLFAGASHPKPSVARPSLFDD